MDKALNLIGLMRKANRVSLTEQKCREDIKAGRSSLVLIASDCSETVKCRISDLAERHGIKYIISEYSTDDLDSGFAEALLKIMKSGS